MDFNHKVAEVFEKLMKDNDKFFWEDVVAAVEKDKIKVKNWLKVRGVMQYFINIGRIVRTKDVMVEEYIVL